jgi:hypothetical protein
VGFVGFPYREPGRASGSACSNFRTRQDQRSDRVVEIADHQGWFVGTHDAIERSDDTVGFSHPGRNAGLELMGSPEVGQVKGRDHHGGGPVDGSQSNPEQSPVGIGDTGEGLGSVAEALEEIASPPDVALGRPTREWVLDPGV